METTAALEPPLLLREQHCTQPRDHRLPLERAWAIALAWHPSLADLVYLVKTGDIRDQVGRVYGSIRFDISLERRNEVSAARAAALTWFGLSCCPGYGGDENPDFWKCVFSEYTKRVNRRSFFQQGQSITDAHGFFDSDTGVEFPRFRLSIHAFHENLRLFCGLPGEHLSTQDDVKLQLIMAEIQPWVDHDRTLRRPEVLLDGVQQSHFDAIEANYPELSLPPVQTEWKRFLRDAAAATTTLWPSPSFNVIRLNFDCAVISSDASYVAKFVQFLRDYKVEITEFVCLESPYNTSSEIATWWDTVADQRHVFRDQLATVVRYALRLPGVVVRGKVTELRLRNLGLPCAPAFLSALPLTTSIHTVEMYPFPRDMFDERYMVWLAYALFHPDTPSSAWKSLAIVDHGFSVLGLSVLRAMAKGNNLTAIRNGQEPTSDGYYRATLALGATVLDQPTSDGAAVLMKSDGVTTVEVCGATSTDPREWSEWVEVVVPAYGLGWVLSTSVASVEKRAPALPFLTRLRQSDNEYRDGESLELPAALHLLGRQLVHLDLGKCWRHSTPTDKLRQALAACPSLESLAVVDDGELFNGDLKPSLCELVIQLPKIQLRDNQLGNMRLPRSLQRLRIVSNGDTTSYRHNTAAVKSILTQCRDHLRVFHWQEDLHKSDHPTPYAETRADTDRRLAELGLPPQSACVRLPAPCAAAFLSVLGHYERLIGVDEAIAKTIVAFAGDGVRRLIVLEPEESEIPDTRRHRPRRGRMM